MFPKHYRPRWWVLYLVLPLMVGMFYLESRAVLSERGHQAVEMIIVLVICSLVWLWLSDNQKGLMLEEQDQVRHELRKRLEPHLSSLSEKDLPEPRQAREAHTPPLPLRVVYWIVHLFN